MGENTFRFLRAVLVLCGISLVIIGVSSRRGLLDLVRIKRENTKLATKIAALQLQKTGLESQIRGFQMDREERERVVRQVLGYIKPNETVIEFE